MLGKFDHGAWDIPAQGSAQFHERGDCLWRERIEVWRERMVEARMSGFARGGDAFAVPPPLTSLLTLLEFSIIEVARAEARELNVPLKAPFVIASSRLERVGNVAVRLVLVDGSEGWGEAPVLPAVTAEDQPTALAKAALACAMLQTSPAMSCRQALANVSALLPGHDFASVPHAHNLSPQYFLPEFFFQIFM